VTNFKCSVQIEWPQSFRNLTALEDISVQFMDDRAFDVRRAQFRLKFERVLITK
jgi:hypothetical protein